MRIGIDLGGTKTEVIALDDSGLELFRKRVATPRHDYRATVNTITALVHEAEQHTQQRGSVGIGMPGTLSPVTGKVKNANSTWLNGQPFDRDMEQTLGRKVRLANDANCLAVSESIDGAGAGQSLVFAAILGTGCGAGLAIKGKAHQGRNGIAGEWGHNPLPWQETEQSIACYCGKTNCVETWLSGTGFSEDYRRMNGAALSGPEIIKRAQAGEGFALESLVRYQHRLAKALANVINILDPDVIVLGGGMSNVDQLYKDVPGLMQQWVFGGECSTPLLKAVHGDSSGIRGAAWLWGPGENAA